MTMPHLMNCAHCDDGWCLVCVKTLHEQTTRLRNALLPFANYWDEFVAETPPKYLKVREDNPIACKGIYEGPTLKDCRRAREALRESC